MFLASIRKTSLYAIQIYGTIIAFLLIPAHAATDPAAIIGGIDLTGTGPAYAALISSSDAITPLALTGDAATGGIISSVSMNSSGNSLLGGQGQTGYPYAALVSSSGSVIPLVITGPPATHGIIYGTAINSNGKGIIGGRDTTGPIYAALVPPSGNPLTPLVFSNPISSGGIINTVSINDSGNGLIGGQGYYNAQPAYAASVSPSGVLTPLTLTGGIDVNGTILSVAI